MATEARYAFATSEDAATVTAIDLATRQAVATLPAGPVAHALTLTQDGERLYVVNRRGGSLTVVDTRALAVLDTIALPTDPMAAAISPDGRWLAVLGRARLVAWVFEAAIARVEKVAGALNPVAADLYDRAREEARSPRPGFFAGVPTLVKDTCDVAGVPTMQGTDAWTPKPAKADGE